MFKSFTCEKASSVKSITYVSFANLSKTSILILANLLTPIDIVKPGRAP